jgi:hypothetical protein
MDRKVKPGWRGAGPGARPNMTYLACMSIVWSLKKLFNPAEHLYEEGEKHAEREHPEDDDSGDPPRIEMAPGGAKAGKSAPERYQCRICDYTSAEGPYCPACLADTMKPLS